MASAPWVACEGWGTDLSCHREAGGRGWLAPRSSGITRSSHQALGRAGTERLSSHPGLPCLVCSMT